MALFQAIRKNVAKFNKNRTRSFYSLLLKNIESNRKRKEMGPLWGWLTSSASGHRDGKAIRAQLPYKASVSRRRADQKCTFWPAFPFASPLGISLSCFLCFISEALPLLCLSIHRDSSPQKQMPSFQHHLGRETTALSEAVFQGYVELSTAWGCCWSRWLGNASLLTLFYIPWK